MLAREDNIVVEDVGLSEPLPSLHDGGYQVNFYKREEGA